MQRVVGDVVVANVGLHVCAGPRRERIDFHQAESPIPLEDAHPTAIGGLIPPNGRDPGLESGQRRPQREDLADFAASVRIALPELSAHLYRLGLHAQARAHRPDGYPVTAFELFPQGVGLGKEQPGVDREDVDREVSSGDQIEQHTPFHAEADREGDARGESSRGPFQHRLRRTALQLSVAAKQLLVGCCFRKLLERILRSGF